jgi:two-component system phosphate regulon sensor histidine kinase PhoR
MKRFFWYSFLAAAVLLVLFEGSWNFIAARMSPSSALWAAHALFFALLLAGLHGYVFTRRIWKPLEKMRQDVERMDRDLNRRIQALGREGEEMTAVLSSMIEGVLVIGARETIVLANAACKRMFDWKNQEIEGRPYWEVLRHRELADLIRRSLEQGSFEDAEISIFMPEEKNLHAQISPLRRPAAGSQAEKAQGLVCVLHDITSIKALEEHRSEFVANVSHELKTPLTSIRGFVETLAEGALEDPSRAKNFLSIIHEHTLRLEKLINGLLDLARLENRELAVQIRSVDLRKIAEKIHSLFENDVRSKGLTFEVDIPPALAPVSADEEKLEQALGNLVQNAIKFTPSGGRVRISVSQGERDTVVAVSDTGIGISPEHQARIFERFYRVDKSRSREQGGTGLGLSIVKHIAQAHGGEVRVESEAGKGSTFSLSLPRHS